MTASTSACPASAPSSAARASQATTTTTTQRVTTTTAAGSGAQRRDRLPAITIANATLAVPTSAIATDGDRHTVTVLDGTNTKQVTVQIGATGQTWTAVTSGLADGQAVVLADLDQLMPNATSSTTNQNNRNGAGGFPGAGGLPRGAGGIPGGAGAPRGG